MNSTRKSRKKAEVSIKELYALNAGAYWAALKEQHVAFWMLCLYYFFEYVRPQSIYPAIDVLPWSQIALLSTVVFAFMDKDSRWVSGQITRLFLLFYVLIIISGVFAFIPALSWHARNVVLSWFLVFFVTVSIVNTEKRLIIFLVAYFLFNFKMSQHGAITWAQRGFSFASWGLKGAPGWFSNSGEYAIQMLIFGSLILSFVYALRDYWSKYKKWVMYAVAATGYMAVMGASSRGSQIALAVIGIWMLFRNGLAFKGLMVLAVFSLLLYTILPDEQILRFQEMGDDKNSLQRLVYWQMGWEIIKENPFTGLGYHNWVAYLSYLHPDGVGPLQKIEEQHNIYIEAASDLGVFGLLVFLLLVYYSFKYNVKTRAMARQQGNRLLESLAYGLDAGLIGYLVAGTFVTVLFYPFFWVQLTMIVVLNNVARRGLPEEMQHDRKQRRHRRKQTS